MHTFWKKKKLSSLASMEDQTHLTLGKENEPSTMEEKTREEIPNKQPQKINFNEEEEGKKKAYSLQSLRERSETPGVLDRRALGITRGERIGQSLM